MTFIAPAAPRPSGSLAAPEPEMLAGLLEYHRITLLHKCAGLTAEQMSTAPYPASNLTLHGLVRHLAKVERVWFRERFAAEGVARLYSTPERKDADFEDVDPATVAADYAALLAEQDAARAVAAGASLDDTYVDADGDEVSLRFIHVHMIGEYARHNGHADFVRQGIDGVTGS
jgi:uncharacterized damage-inducible protein DinB